MLLKPDSLSVCKRQELVVIHDRVHVLHPDCIYITIIKDVPSLWLVHRNGLVDFTEDLGQQTISPITCLRIQDPIQLIGGDSLWIDWKQFGGQVESFLLCCSETIKHNTFTSTSRPDNHGSVPGQHSLVQLHDLIALKLIDLLILGPHCVLFKEFLDADFELSMSYARTIQPWEQILEQTLEKRYVRLHKLGHVHVAQGAHEHHVLRQVRRASFQVPSHHKHGLQSSKLKVVVILFR
mmetsp:Transcript_141451/g.271457  ORF Transcript_141451/g.271457 Transcript_141451/m.271457 type:complete len:237 (+) Transcript_141451:6980-7690(+)